MWLDLYFDLEDRGDIPPKRRLTFYSLHGDTYQQSELFVNRQADRISVKLN
jgi:hypothetical protein